MSAKILIVDDTDIIRALIKEILDSSDYDISEASNGQEAIEILAKNDIDLVITDIFMPEMSGIELAIKIKSNYPHIKILGITAGGNQVTSDEALNMFSDHFESILSKPIDQEELLDNVKYLLNID
ncbi:MAG: two-component system response regulator [Planctomycetota bacterium]|nr:MAG: two-component system response regulator [Planctomycetota bacterium]